MEKNIIAQVKTRYGIVKVERHEALYDVWCDDVVRHPNCSADSAMRALAQYIKTIDYQWEKADKKQLVSSRIILPVKFKDENFIE